MNFRSKKFKFSDKLLSSVKILYPNALLRNCLFPKIIFYIHKEQSYLSIILHHIDNQINKYIYIYIYM